jgi:hypothetical protein
LSCVGFVVFVVALVLCSAKVVDLRLKLLSYEAVELGVFWSEVEWWWCWWNAVFLSVCWN